MSKNMTCIYCPLGCRIHIEKKGKTTQITGYRCKDGEEYILQEIRDPKRMLTTTVPINNGPSVLLSMSKPICFDNSFSGMRPTARTRQSQGINRSVPTKGFNDSSTFATVTPSTRFLPMMLVTV